MLLGLDIIELKSEVDGRNISRSFEHEDYFSKTQTKAIYIIDSTFEIACILINTYPLSEYKNKYYDNIK